MHPDLQKLMDIALQDGELTDKERAIILRKAEALGEDKDEIEMILEGRISKIKKDSAPTSKDSAPTSNKQGDAKKCPSCGAPVESFQTKCKECGHEFRNITAVSSIQTLSTLLNQITMNTVRQEGFLHNAYTHAQDVAQAQVPAISNFPIPSTKEDLLEFLAVAYPKAKMHILGFWAKAMIGIPDAILSQAWHGKCEEVIIKARFAMKGDRATLDEIEDYAKRLKIT